MMNHYDIKLIYQWPPKMRLAAAAIIGIFVFILGYFWNQSSTTVQMEKSIEQEADLKQQISIIYKNINATKKEIAQLPELRSMFHQWQKQLVTEDQTSEALNTILKTGAANNIYFNLFNPDPPQPAGDYKMLPIKVIMVSDHYQLGNFLSQVASLPFIVVIGDFTISRENRNDLLGAKLADKANLNNLLTTELTLFLYYLPEKHPNEKPA